ncbi:DUF3781 domain-containing protein [Flavobacterium sp.]
MSSNKIEILSKICYTELVYERINKKLMTNFSKLEIKTILFSIIAETEDMFFNKIGKNIYVTSNENNIKLTINSNTFRVITADRIFKDSVIK